MKALVLTVGDAHVASTQYRFGQFSESLRDAGVEMVMLPASGFTDWKLAATMDIVVVQKRLMRASWVSQLRKNARRLVFDTDDAIWHPHGKPHSWWTRLRTMRRLKAICGAADLCTVPNDHLAAFLRPLARRVEVIPMALDESQWFPASCRRPGPLRIGWAGAPPNLTYLARLGEVLADIRREHPQTEVHVYCGQRPDFGSGVRFTHIPFAPGTEAEAVRNFDIGLLPLPDDDFAAGKSPIKALQYAACAVPCIASPVGATRETVRDGETGLTAASPAEWARAIATLADDEPLRRRLGEHARSDFLAHHTRAAVQRRLLDCWHALVSGRQ
jgi:glycosyltransferase involved in cell wall biosynthesis